MPDRPLGPDPWKANPDVESAHRLAIGGIFGKGPAAGPRSADAGCTSPRSRKFRGGAGTSPGTGLRRRTTPRPRPPTVPKRTEPSPTGTDPTSPRGNPAVALPPPDSGSAGRRPAPPLRRSRRRAPAPCSTDPRPPGLRGCRAPSERAHSSFGLRTSQSWHIRKGSLRPSVTAKHFAPRSSWRRTSTDPNKSTGARCATTFTGGEPSTVLLVRGAGLTRVPRTPKTLSPARNIIRTFPFAEKLCEPGGVGTPRTITSMALNSTRKEGECRPIEVLNPPDENESFPTPRPNYNGGHGSQTFHLQAQRKRFPRHIIRKTRTWTGDPVGPSRGLPSPTKRKTTPRGPQTRPAPFSHAENEPRHRCRNPPTSHHVNVEDQLPPHGVSNGWTTGHPLTFQLRDKPRSKARPPGQHRFPSSRPGATGQYEPGGVLGPVLPDERKPGSPRGGKNEHNRPT